MKSKNERKSNNNEIKKIPKENAKRAEMEKELNIQRNHRQSGKVPNMSQMQINHLNYYNEIAKQNTRCMMNNPSFKDVIRITSDESCLEELKQKMQSKDLLKLLDQLPLMRVERINYKTKEIGKMRRNLAKYNHVNKFVYIDEERGKEFAGNVFARRLKEGGKYVPVKSIDNLYNTETYSKLSRTPNTKYNIHNKLLAHNHSEIWTQKYKSKNTSVNKNNNINNNNNKSEMNNRRNVFNIRKAMGKEDAINKIKTFTKYNTNNQILNTKNKNENEKSNIKSEMNTISTIAQSSEKKVLTIGRKKELNDLRHNNIASSTLIPQKEERIKINLRSRFREYDKNVIKNNIVKNNVNNNNNRSGFYSKFRMKLNSTNGKENKENKI
jgi:hypothetical protein